MSEPDQNHVFVIAWDVQAFYVNRGQGIAAFGTENKEHPLMEFSSANKAYQETPYVGFRTFLKGKRAVLCDISSLAFMHIVSFAS
jgi:hypothetical protein